MRSVLFSNNGQNCDFTAEFTVLSSIASDNTCPGFIETDPLIGPLKDYGGNTKTHALLPGSPARDAAIDYPSLYTDQRQLVRPLDSDGDGVVKWDIGAFEAEYVAFPIMQLAPTYTPTPVLGTQIFIPKEYPPCRQGPAFLYAAVGLLDPNTSYSVLGVNRDKRWFALQYALNTHCWVRAEDGQLSSDPELLEVIPFTIVTITPTITPTGIISTFDCGKYTSSDQCSMDNRCQWVGVIAPHCENK